MTQCLLKYCPVYRDDITQNTSVLHRMYYKLFKERYGDSRGGEAQVTQLKQFIDDINDGQPAAPTTTSSEPAASEPAASETDVEEQPTTQEQPQPGRPVIKMLVTDDNQVVVAVCTPLMQRVHKLVKHSGEIVFCDASGNMDRNQCRVFVLLTHSCVGGRGFQHVTRQRRKNRLSYNDTNGIASPINGNGIASSNNAHPRVSKSHYSQTHVIGSGRQDATCSI